MDPNLESQLKLRIASLENQNEQLINDTKSVLDKCESISNEKKEAEERLHELEKSLVKQVNENVSLKSHNARLVEESLLSKIYPEIQKEQYLMNFQLKMAQEFSDAKAFGSYTPQQIYTLMKAGAEMGMAPIESLQSLYIVNGAIDYYGDKMIARLTSLGYKIEYLDEVANVSVKVRISKGDEVYEEIADIKDAVLVKSKAMTFAPKNKLRFHGVRMVASFYLPHHFKGAADLFTPAYREFEKAEEIQVIEESQEIENDAIKKLIDDTETLDELNAIKKTYVKELSKNVNLTIHWGRRVKEIKSK